MTNNKYITEKFINAALEMNTKFLRQPWKTLWSNKYPLWGYCYVIAEVLYHYVLVDSVIMRVKVEAGWHWYLIYDNEIIDSVPPHIKIDYSTGIRGVFLTKEPSKRAKIFANKVFTY